MKNSIYLEEVLISVKYEEINFNVIQTFSFDKKHKKFILDPRYILHDKFENKIKEYFLNGFIKRTQEDNYIKFFYEDQVIYNKNTMFKLVDFVPPNLGCEYCIYNEEQNGYVFCELKAKLLTEEIKTCKFFKQKVLYKT